MDNAFDFGNFRNIAITGTKFNDINGNGTRDNGEPGLAGFVFQLINAANGSVIAEATSSASGSFAFPNRGPLPNGASYRVREIQQTGWVQTNPDPADIPPRSGQNVSLAFGNFRGVTISGAVYLDSNFNGVRDFGERGVPGSLVQLLRNGVQFDTRVSAADGSYSFTVIGPGADLSWSAELHAPILAALQQRDPDAVVAALASHFDEVREAMAARWPEDAPTPDAALRDGVATTPAFGA